MITTPLTWKELEAQGVRRCCAMFKSGGQCRRRALSVHGFSWCAKHGPMIERTVAEHMRVIKAEANEPDTDNE